MGCALRRRRPGNATLHPWLKEAESWRCFRPERRAGMMHVGARVGVGVRTLSQVLLEARTEVGAEGGGEGGGEGGAHGEVGLLKLDVEGSEVEVLRGIEEEDWPRLQQVVVETHSGALHEATRRLLEARFEVVGEVPDEELGRCGLHRAIVYARRPKQPSVPTESHL